jgi:TonB family protein
MLDNLVESKKYAGESRKFRGLFAVTSVMMAIILLTGFVVNLFSQELVLGADNLELSTLVAPVEVPPEKPPVEMPQEQTKSTSPVKQDKLPTRKFNIQRTDETPVKVPKTISTTPSENKARPNSYFQLSNIDSEPVAKGGLLGSGKGDGAKPNSSIKPNSQVVAKNDEEEKVTPPPVLTKPTPKVEKKKTIVTGGVINGKATNLVKPVYSAAAKSVGAKGDVKIQVTISEDGNVISASVLDGHPLLRQSALQAARSSKFTPTLLSGEKVQVKGIIIYRFSG